MERVFDVKERRCLLPVPGLSPCAVTGGAVWAWNKGIVMSSIHYPELTLPPALVKINLQMKLSFEQVPSTLRSHLCPHNFFF